MGPLVWLMFVVAGAIVFHASVFNLEWFFAHGQAAWLVKFVGRTHARLVYGVYGLFLIWFGFMVQ